MLAFTSACPAIDRFVAARALLHNLVEALHEIGGKRRERLAHNFSVALAGLERDAVPAVGELARLLRAQWAVLSSAT
ncbi:MAG: hypothetical protein HY901_23590 [Deltaproteobacteria bacterium]|nr:hypothetical protein [Deltaproteobacteria bacterium]